ncbi:MAG: MOSC domain-containing protein [Planctomycetes bacterium]|nr:MOSC domain-containing protein [Planctomycetota bacterium]
MPPSPPPAGRVHQISLSDGGVPKLAVPHAEVRSGGLLGDRQRDLRHHGGPERAVCLLALEVVERLAAEGHPIVPGSTGENLTLAGLDWEKVQPGTRFVFAGGVELEVTSWAVPCRLIAGSFADGGFGRLHADATPKSSRAYARVLREGRITTGEDVRLA